jgi:gamma-glutamylputrescine oxidase
MTLSEKNIRNYYTDSAPAQARRPALVGDHEYDVAVVGGGIAGCSTALHLAERGYRVALLEGERIGFGASGRSGAQLIFGYACGQEKIEKLVGRDTARTLWQITADGLELVRERVARHAIECDLSWGQLHVAIKPRQRDALKAECERLVGDYGYRSASFLGRDEVESLLATRRYCAALRDANSGHCHPLKYVQGLARAAEQAGTTIYESSRVTGLERGPVATLSTATGRIRAKFVALTGNTYLEGLVPELQRKVMAVGTYVVATEPLGAERARALIRDNLAVADVNFVLDYFRLSNDHRLLFGGRVSYSGLDPLGTERATRARMLQVFPQLSDARIDYAWGGYVDITVNRAPHFGRLGSNMYFLQGFSGHGMALTGIAGKLLAEAIAGQAGRFDLFARIPHMDFPGGLALRRPALVLGMLWYRMRDLL